MQDLSQLRGDNSATGLAKATAKLFESSTDERRFVEMGDHGDNASELLVLLLTSHESDMRAAASRGPEDVTKCLNEHALFHRSWLVNAAQYAYFDDLTKRAGVVVCAWVQGTAADGRTSLAALSHLLTSQKDMLTRQDQLQDLLTQMEQVLRQLENNPNAGAPLLTQNIHDHGQGFIGGTHHHHYQDAPDPSAAVHSSMEATCAGTISVRPIDQWDPKELGVHASITVHEETTLTPYLPRAHDHQLRKVLAALTLPGATCRFVLVVGTSCTGKTRTLHEAVRSVLPDWHIVVPRTDTDLASVLLHGIPARTILWLDELQDRLTVTRDGFTAAKAMQQLLDAPGVGPILMVGTIWPINLITLRSRPTEVQATAGAGAIRTLLAAAAEITLPETFTDNDLATAAEFQDPRLRTAIETATQISHPEHGRKITQVLAGGTQLVHRLYPPVGAHQHDAFSPAAKAILRAAGDLRRVGMPNPLPAWAIEGAAPGYLESPTQRPPSQWMDVAWAEVTQAASREDPVTGTHTLDIHAEGIPALTPIVTHNPSGSPTLKYDLHDYLRDHLRRRPDPTSEQLWRTATTPEHIGLMGPDVLSTLGRSAEDRGLTRHAITLWRAARNTASVQDQERTVGHLATLGDTEALIELRSRATQGAAGQDQLAAALGTLAERGDDAARDELRERSGQGDNESWWELRSLLIAEGREGADTVAPPPPSSGTIAQGSPSGRLSIGRLRSPMRSRAEYAYITGDVERLLRLRSSSSDAYIGRRLAGLLLETNRIDQMAESAKISQNVYRAHAAYERLRTVPDDELRQQAHTEPFAAQTLALQLLQNNQIDELAGWAPENSAASAVLVRHYFSVGDVEGLKQCTYRGYGSIALESLRVLYRVQQRGAGVLELDVLGKPVPK